MHICIRDMVDELLSQFHLAEVAEPDAWIYLDNGRRIQVSYITNTSEPYFITKLHCSNLEAASERFISTGGVITQTSAMSQNLFDTEKLWNMLLYITSIDKSKEIVCQI